MGFNYWYPCRGITRTGKVVRGGVFAPNAVAARRNFVTAYFGDKKPVTGIKVGKRQAINR